MIGFQNISRAVAACGLTLLAASFAHAQGPSVATGSTDIYTTDFQKAFATGSLSRPEPRTVADTGSTDIWTTDFQKTFATDKSVHETRDMARYKGSTDIWTTDFQKTFM